MVDVPSIFTELPVGWASYLTPPAAQSGPASSKADAQTTFRISNQRYFFMGNCLFRLDDYGAWTNQPGTPGASVEFEIQKAHNANHSSLKVTFCFVRMASFALMAVTVAISPSLYPAKGERFL